MLARAIPMLLVTALAGAPAVAVACDWLCPAGGAAASDVCHDTQAGATLSRAYGCDHAADAEARPAAMRAPIERVGLVPAIASDATTVGAPRIVASPSIARPLYTSPHHSPLTVLRI